MNYQVLNLRNNEFVYKLTCERKVDIKGVLDSPTSEAVSKADVPDEPQEPRRLTCRYLGAKSRQIGVATEAFSSAPTGKKGERFASLNKMKGQTPKQTFNKLCSVS